VTFSLGQRKIVFSLLAVITVIDQSTKWWAWRHAATARVNSGGDVIVGSTVSRWYADPGKGALLDLLDIVLLSVAIFLLLRARRSLPVLVPGALMIGGWGTNLLDRLGMHYVTAPGSARGAVDFIHIGRHFYNVADMFILVATPLFVVAAIGSYLRRWVAGAPSVDTQGPSAVADARRIATHPVSLLAAITVTAVVAIGAANYGGVTAPTRTAVAGSAGPAIRGPGAWQVWATPQTSSTSYPLAGVAAAASATPRDLG
jgi:lipoprotein signal peptidase